MRRLSGIDSLCRNTKMIKRAATASRHAQSLGDPAVCVPAVSAYDGLTFVTRFEAPQRLRKGRGLIADRPVFTASPWRLGAE
jgi:hypothetical protein